jgi:transcriptional regulator with XRE-family HTH domain
MPEELMPGVGVSVSVHRQSAGITQVGLAGRIGRPVQWVAAVERGRRCIDQFSDLMAIATVLGCRIDDLLGRPIDPRSTPIADLRIGRAAGVRAVLLGAPIPIPTDLPAPTPEEISPRIDQAWALWHGSPTAHTELATVLPSLLTDALTSHQQARDRQASARVLSGAWQITRQWLHHLPEGDLAWIAAERAMAAAREAEDPRLIALAAWGLSSSYRWAGQPDEATRLCLAADDLLIPLLDAADPDPALLAARGALHLSAAIGAAHLGQDGRAWALHQIAARAATAAGDRYDPWTTFGPATVDCWAIAIHAALGHPDAVVEHAARLDVDSVPSAPARAGVLIDSARGYLRRHEDEAAVLVLLDAERASSDEVRHHVLAREMVRELFHHDRARARPHIRDLARRIGLVAA